MQSPPAPRQTLIAGATGLVGRCLLDLLLRDPGYMMVVSIGRRPVPGLVLPKVAGLERLPALKELRVDFADLPTLAPVDDVFITLGTTIRVAGSQAAFRAVDFDAVVATARAARQCGASRLGVVSAMGANAHSRVFYNRVKGEMEDAISVLGYDSVVIARPSLIEGDRSALQQPGRMGEAWGQRVARVVNPLLPRNLKSIAAADVAAALLRHVRTGAPGRHVVESGALRR